MKSNINSTNCLALTIKKEYHLTIVKNRTIKAISVSAKVLFVVFVLNFVNLFV